MNSYTTVNFHPNWAGWESLQIHLESLNLRKAFNSYLLLLVIETSLMKLIQNAFFDLGNWNTFLLFHTQQQTAGNHWMPNWMTYINSWKAFYWDKILDIKSYGLCSFESVTSRIRVKQMCYLFASWQFKSFLKLFLSTFWIQ